jgi:hypothetical protein
LFGVTFWKKIGLSFARAFIATFVLGVGGAFDAVASGDTTAARSAAVALDGFQVWVVPTIYPGSHGFLRAIPVVARTRRAAETVIAVLAIHHGVPAAIYTPEE